MFDSFGYYGDGFEMDKDAQASAGSVENDDGLLRTPVTPLSIEELMSLRDAGEVGHPVVSLSSEEQSRLKAIEKELGL